MTYRKKWLALLIPLAAASTPAGALVKSDPAPRVMRKAPAPVTPRSEDAPLAIASARNARPVTMSATDYLTALSTVADPRGDTLLDRGLMTAMSRLMEAGRCPDAAVLATQNARPSLASRARQICSSR